MLYLEDYLELIEHLPQELRDRLTLIRENDLKVNNSNHQIDTRVKQFFAEAKQLSPGGRQSNFESILKEYEKTIENADEKLQLADQTSEILLKLIQKLDGELEKFKLELEADHAGITEHLERRSLELDAEAQLNETFTGSLNTSSSSRHSGQFKERRRSDHEHRHHPYHSNGYHSRAKLSQNHNDYDDIYNNLHLKRAPQANRLAQQRYAQSNQSSRHNSTATSPAPNGQSPNSGPPSIIGDNILNGTEMNGSGHYDNNLTSFVNNPGFRTSYKNNNLPYIQHESTLSMLLREYQLEQTKYCICRQVSYGQMVACDNEDCEIQWFHFGCVGLTTGPPGKWYCPECLNSMRSQYKKSQIYNKYNTKI